MWRPADDFFPHPAHAEGDQAAAAAGRQLNFIYLQCKSNNSNKKQSAPINSYLLLVPSSTVARLLVVSSAEEYNQHSVLRLSYFSSLSAQTICQKTPDKTAEYFAAVWALNAIGKVTLLRICTF